MDRLIYSSLAAMRGAMARQATIANNLANVNTVGFRGEFTSAEAEILGKYDGAGQLIGLGIAFRGTGGLGYSDTFMVLGVVLLLSAIAILLTKKAKASVAGGGAH